MKKHQLRAVILSIALLVAPTLSVAAEGGTAKEARAMLDRAVAELKANQAAALDKFNKGAAGFKDRDLYVFCVAADGKVVSHPDASMRGQDVNQFKDKPGMAFGTEMLKQAKENQVSTITYMFPRPGSTEPVQKESYITKVRNLVCGVGYYK
jgi:signal transduction histidine kinase